MKKNSIFFLILIALAFHACANKNPQIQEATTSNEELKLILIKSPNISFYDFCTLQTTPEIKINVFKLGKVAGSVTIKDNEICLNDKCASKWMASKSFFGKVSYDTLFEEIIRDEDIFEGRGKELGENGTIIQRFSYGGEEIYYERSKNRIYFKNLTNNVIVSITPYKP